MKSDASTFAELVRTRSRENSQALRAAVAHGWAGIAIGILRQELDSLVRAIFLLSVEDKAARRKLLRASLEGQVWRVPARSGKMKRITDRDMVTRANQLHGWTESVYRFGCAFIHLSGFHDYQARDPIKALPVDERQALLTHLRKYHGRPERDDVTITDLVPLLPMIFEKITSNLDVYLRNLENGANHD